MLEGIFLQSYGFFGGGFLGNVFNQWADTGIFAVVLPFLLIFAIVFGVMERAKIFKNKAIHVVIAVVVGLMALQFGFVTQFFAFIFPKLGIGIVAILVIIILAGLFWDTKKPGVAIPMMILGVLIAIIIFFKTATELGWSIGFTLGYYWPHVLGVLILIGAFIWVILSGRTRDPSRASLEWNAPISRDD